MARKKIKDMIEELRSWLPNYDHKDYPTTVFRLLASLPGGDELEDMGYEPMPGISWQEADQLGRMLEAIQDKRDVEDMVAGLAPIVTGEVGLEASRTNVRALPKGQSTYTIKISGGRNDGEYEGDKTLSATVKKAKAEFLPNLGPHETLKVVHFDRDGERTIVDTVIHSPPLGGPPPSVREHPYPSQVRQSSRTGSLRARTTSKGGK
jgi:hypothetical protein